MPVIALTGATGLIGAKVLQLLLEAGHEVRACVRDPANPKCDILRAVARAAGTGKLVLVRADLTKPGSFTEAFTGAEVVINTAAVVQMHFDHDPFEVIGPACDGNRDIARTANTCGVRRIVNTGSVASIIQREEQREPRFRGRMFTEDEVRFDLRPHECPYQCAKLMSERILNETFQGEAISLLPTWTVGDQIPKESTSSHQLIKMLANRETGAMCPLNYAPSFVSVSDVARAHVHAAFCDMPTVDGVKVRTRRYILSSSQAVNAFDFCEAIRRQFPHLSPPKWVTPWWLLWCVSWCDKRISPFMLNEKTVINTALDGSRIERELTGFKYAHNKSDSLDVCVKAAVESMIKHGTVAAAPTK